MPLKIIKNPSPNPGPTEKPFLVYQVDDDGTEHLLTDVLSVDVGIFGDDTVPRAYIVATVKSIDFDL